MLSTMWSAVSAAGQKPDRTKCPPGPSRAELVRRKAIERILPPAPNRNGSG